MFEKKLKGGEKDLFAEKKKSTLSIIDARSPIITTKALNMFEIIECISRKIEVFFAMMLTVHEVPFVIVISMGTKLSCIRHVCQKDF